jgi:hypothetical protein
MPAAHHWGAPWPGWRSLFPGSRGFHRADNSYGDGLHAFEAAAGIEIRALLAGMQFEAALGTFVSRRSDEYGAALGATRNRARPGQIDRLRTKRVGLFGRSGIRPLARTGARFSIAVAILITMLTVFSHEPSGHAGVLSRQSRLRDKSEPAFILQLPQPRNSPAGDSSLLGTRYSLLGTRHSLQ